MLFLSLPLSLQPPSLRSRLRLRRVRNPLALHPICHALTGRLGPRIRSVVILRPVHRMLVAEHAGPFPEELFVYAALGAGLLLVL